MDKKISILFLGGAGFIGSNVIKHLLDTKQYDIHVLEPEFAVVNRLDGYNVTLHRGVLSDYEKLNSLLITNKIKIVVHLVSTMNPGSLYSEFVNEFHNIVFPTIQLMHICAERKIKFIYFSSGGTVYGNRPFVTPLTENDNIAPVSHYGWLKQMMENSILFIHRTKGMEYLILRPSNPYGPGQGLFGKQGLIAVAIGKILTNETIEIWGDGSSVRDYIFIDDLGEIVSKLIVKGVNNTIINIGSGVGVSVNDIILCLKEIVDGNLEVDYRKARSVDVNGVILDTNKLKDYVKYDLTSLKEGIFRFYEYAKNTMLK